MSEPTAPAAAPVESSVPESSTDIVAAAAADIRADEAAPESGSSTTGTTTTTTGTTTAEPTANLTAAEKDELAEALGITGEGSAKWTARINYSKVHKAVKALREKQEAAHAAALKQHEESSASHRQQVERFDSLVSNPDQLLRALASVNPAYAQYVKGAAPQQPQGTPQRIETMEDLQRVIDQQVAQRLKPIETERAAAQFEAQAIPKVKAMLAEAQTWPMFKENMAEIQAAHAKLPQNIPPGEALRMAYHSVVTPKLAANRDTIRQEVMDELKNRPHSSTVTTTVAGRGTQSAEPVDSVDIVRAAAARIRD